MAYTFKFELNHLPVPVWRIVDVPDHFSLYRLHLTMQGAFGWQHAHLYEFKSKTAAGVKTYGDSFLNDGELPDVEESRTVAISKLFKKKGDKLDYFYDFGDGWHHTIELKKRDSEEMLYPVCREGSGKCPPEDVGGPPGYVMMLEALSATRHPERASYRTWLGLKPREQWDPHEFNFLETHKRLCLVVE